MLSVRAKTNGVEIEFTEPLKINNSGEPNIYWIGLNDSSGTSMLDKTVDVGEWYNFTLVANYSAGWSNCQVVVEAWYDYGMVGAGSAYPSETESNRNLAFKLMCWPSNFTYLLTYPSNPEMEIIPSPWPIEGAWWPHPTDSNQDHYYLWLPVYLGQQLRTASGQGFSSGDPSYDFDPNTALQDAYSWDFEVTVMDSSNNSLATSCYGEFGINPDCDISVAGNPAGTAPPGTAANPMSNPTQITYSANSDYWVNVSISNLMKDGIGPLFIPATDVSVQNICPNATALNSDIAMSQTPVILADTPMCVWGVPGTPVTAPNSGTNAIGPHITNYNAPIWGENHYTQLDWWVTVPPGTPDGTYSTPIELTIEPYGQTAGETFDPMTWDKHGMVIDNGGTYDTTHASSPSVLFDQGEYKMWYQGYEGSTYRIHYANSSDGQNWSKYGMVLNIGGIYDSLHAGNPSVLKVDGEYKMWYGGSDGTNARILLAILLLPLSID